MAKSSFQKRNPVRTIYFIWPIETGSLTNLKVDSPLHTRIPGQLIPGIYILSGIFVSADLSGRKQQSIFIGGI